MPSKSKSNDRQRATHTDSEESKAKRDDSKDDLLQNLIKTSTGALIYVFNEILIFHVCHYQL